jgi:hypothetical protein
MINRPNASITDAITRAQQTKRNTYIVNGQIDHAGLAMVFTCVGRIRCRIRFCFENALLIGEATDALCAFFTEDSDLDTLFFLHSTFQKPDPLLSSLKSCASLTMLSFCGCHLTDRHIELLTASFQGLRNLRSLELTHDHLGPSAFANVCQAIP